MFIYLFEHPLFRYQYRKLVLSFPITEGIRKSLTDEGFIEIDLFGPLDKTVIQ